MKNKLLLFFILFFSANLIASAKEIPGEKDKVTIFHSFTCHTCVKLMHEFIPKFQEDFKERIDIEYREIGDIENYKFLLGLQEQYKAALKNELPVVFFKGHFLTGEKEIKKNLYRLVESRAGKEPAKEGILPVDLFSRLLGFSPFVVVSLGLTDGINPCAFTVIVFFISFLALQGYRKRELIIIGLCFISSVFVTYLLIGLGIFGFFYRISGFWMAVRTINILIGLFSIVLGALALYDFFKFKKTGDAEGLTLQLPKAVKDRIHSVIGLYYRKPKDNREQTAKVHVARLALSALITGFVVSILEAVCTGQVYLPTITFVLKTSNAKLQALGYLLLYNFMFILPLFIIFLFALLGVTSGEFSRILKRYLSAVKILMAVLFFSLGLFLIWRA
jgi:cytochrome c biogenesis protein CcdA